MIFLDANFIISLIVTDHGFNKRAVELWEENKNKEKIISNLIISEVMTVLNIKLKEDTKIIKQAYEFMNTNLLLINDVNYFTTALNRLIKYNPDRLSFFDTVYISLMNDLNVKEIISFDKHFDNKENIVRIH